MKKFAFAFAAVLATAGVAAAQDIASQMVFPPASQTGVSQDLDYNSTGSIKKPAAAQQDAATQADRD